MSMKNSNDTRDVPTCSAVPQPTAPPLTPLARLREERNAYRILMRKPEGRDHLEYLDINRNIILYVILKELDGMSLF